MEIFYKTTQRVARGEFADKHDIYNQNQRTDEFKLLNDVNTIIERNSVKMPLPTAIKKSINYEDMAFNF